MGIPSLFRWLKDKYPLIINNTNKVKTDCLHIDFNALLHISTHPEDGGILSKKEMFNLLIYNLNRLIDKIKPTKLLHLATDGVAPRAKLNQQRARRFCTAQEARKNNENGEQEDINTFDINSLTPGTVFMKEISDFIINFINYKQSTDPNYKKLEIIYSDDSVPGEGEHKILKYIRMTETYLKHSIYSPDADLIFLGLTLHRYDIHIIREDLDYISTFKKEKCTICNKKGHRDDQCCKLRLEKILFISIIRLRTYLKNEFDIIGRSYNLDFMINDLILICFLAGNDFLPTLPMLDVRFQAIEYLSKAMISIFNGEYLTTPNGINFNRLQHFMIYLSKSEDELYLKKIKELDELRSRFFSYKKFERIDLSTSIGKKEYYNKKLFISIDEKRSDLCYSYLRGMAWVYSYYQGNINNWDYFYPQHYAPFASDICKLRINNIQFRDTKPLCRFNQLLLVLPPDSRNLVPICFQKIFDDEKLYPRKVRIDRFDKLCDWQSVVRMPLISVAKVIEFSNNNLKFLSNEELLRNKEGKDILFLNTEFNKNSLSSKLSTEKNKPVLFTGILNYLLIKNKNMSGSIINKGKTEEANYDGLNFLNKSSIYSIIENQSLKDINSGKRKRVV